MPDNCAADQAAEEKGGENSKGVKRDPVVGLGQFHAEHGNRAGHVTERLVVLAENPHCVDRAGGGGEDESAGINPAGRGGVANHCV